MRGLALSHYCRRNAPLPQSGRGSLVEHGQARRGAGHGEGRLLRASHANSVPWWPCPGPGVRTTACQGRPSCPRTAGTPSAPLPHTYKHTFARSRSLRSPAP